VDFKKLTQKYHPKHPFGAGVFGVVFFGLRRWGGVPFYAFGVVFRHFGESNCFSSFLFSHEKVCKKGSNTTPKGKIPPQTDVCLGGL
jgi:hypothetical protein